MMRLLLLIVTSLVLCSPATVHAEQLVREFSGSRSLETAEFEVKSPWLIDWLVNSEFPNDMGISIDLLSAGTESYAGRIVKIKRPDNGLRLMNEGGRFRFKVDSAVANWRIKVIQLTEEEAELYAPRNELGY
jgi:hypothetical protein